MNLLNDNGPDSKFKIIAESSNNLRIELIKSVGLNDSIQIINLSKELDPLYGKNALINNNNIKKYFNRNTYPFVARLNNKLLDLS